MRERIYPHLVPLCASCLKTINFVPYEFDHKYMIPTNIAIERKTIASTWLKQEYPIYPTLGLVSTIVSTLAAMFAIPANTTTPDALFPSALIMTCGLAIAPFISSLAQS